MSKSPKQIVKEFHQANIINAELDFKNYFNEECGIPLENLLDYNN